MTMQTANESQPEEGHARRGAELRRAVSRPPDLQKHDRRGHTREPSTPAFFQRISAACDWLTGSVQRVRRVLSQTRLTSFNDRSSTSERASREIQQAVPIKVAAADAKRRVDCGERFAFVDARTVDEWIESPGRIERSVRMTVSEVGERLKALPRDRTIVTYCTSRDEKASGLVAIDLARLGRLNVHPMVGRLDAWRAAGGPIERV